MSQISGEVMPHPVIVIDLRGERVVINGEPVELERGGDPRVAAVHTVARDVAQRLRRPVRALALEEGATTRFVVNEDGSTSEIQEETTDDSQQPAEPFTDDPGTGSGEIAALERILDAGTAAAPLTAPAARPPAGRPPEAAPLGDDAAGSRPSFITAGRSVLPAQSGWRGSLNRAGLNLAAGAEERAYREDMAAVARRLTGTRTVSVVNAKGSACKTPTVACLAAVFARVGGAGVLAWDNNETEGTLGFRTDWSPHQATMLNLLENSRRLMAQDAAVAEMSGFVHHQPQDKYDVLWSDTTIDSDHVVSAEDVATIHQVASRYYRMTIMDSGNNSRAQNWRAMIERTDALVVPCTNVEDTAEVGARLLETLTKRGGHSADLARDALVVVSQRTREGKNMDRIVSNFAGLAREVVRIPYDPALETGVIRFEALRGETQRAWLGAAAAVTRAM